MYTQHMLRIICVLVLSGCAHQVAPHLSPDQLTADCRYSGYQSDRLQAAIQAYESSGDTDYNYYQQLKNNLWSLRSGCQNMRNS